MKSLYGKGVDYFFRKRTNSHKENRTVPEELALEYDLHKSNFLNWLYMNAE